MMEIMAMCLFQVHSMHREARVQTECILTPPLTLCPESQIQIHHVRQIQIFLATQLFKPDLDYHIIHVRIFLDQLILLSHHTMSDCLFIGNKYTSGCLELAIFKHQGVNP